MTRSSLVGFLDRRAAGHRVWVVAQPCAPLERDDIVAALTTFSRTPAGEQLTLTPDAGSARWSRGEPAIAVERLDSPAAAPFDDFRSVLKSTRPEPVHIVLAGDTVCLGIDHGLGDGAFMLSLLNTVTRAGLAEPARRSASAAGRARFPMALAMRMLLRAPNTVAPAARLLFDRTHADARPVSATAGPSEAADGRTAVWAGSRSGFVDDLLGRTSSPGSATLASTVMLSVTRALRAHGVQVADRIQVVADLRRYLPAGRWTTSNFTSVFEARCSDSTTADLLSDMVERQIRSGVPLLTAAASRGAGTRARLRRAGSSTPATGDAVTATFSDLTKLSFDRVNWADPAEPRLAVLLPPGSPRHIAVGFAVLGRRRLQLTATFSGANVDAAAVSAALQDVLH